jgi:hypothetical protein
LTLTLEIQFMLRLRFESSIYNEYRQYMYGSTLVVASRYESGVRRERVHDVLNYSSLDTAQRVHAARQC